MKHIYGLPPGPYWPAFHPSNDQCEATGKIQRDVPGGLRDVCRVVFDQTLDDGASHKTLQLFAAAPELLEACQIARLFITLRHKPEWSDGCSCISEQLPCASCVWKDLDAAIAKATGGGLTQ